MRTDENNMPELCYIVVPSAAPGKRIGIVKRGESGYYLTDFDTDPDVPTKAKDGFSIESFVAEMNEGLRVSPAQAEAMMIGSMFGWHVPGAQVRRRA